MRSLLLLATLVSCPWACYSKADDDDVAGDDDDTGSDGDGDGDSDVDGDVDADVDADMPDVAVDPAGALPDGDLDEDGLANATDTDDDGDAVPDDRDVDADGDGLVDEMPPEDVIEAAWASVQTECQWAAGCCSWVVQHFSSEEDLPPCHEGLFGDLLVDFAQAAATAGAAVDAEAWLEEKRSRVPWEGGGLNCPDEAVEKGQVTRRETIDGLLLPWFHGTTAIGDPCFTLWDCAVDARCEGLLDGSGEPGTCAVRPYEGGPCAGSEPYCLVGNTCNVRDNGSICERPRDENEFCSAFELGGRRTDNCRDDQWCDVDLETPACRPMLRVGDPCTEDRQCLAFECTDEGDGPACPPFPDWFQNARELMRDWCHEMLPSTEPIEGL